LKVLRTVPSKDWAGKVNTPPHFPCEPPLLSSYQPDPMQGSRSRCEPPVLSE